MQIEMTECVDANVEQPLVLTLPDTYADQIRAIRDSGCGLTCERIGVNKVGQYIVSPSGVYDGRITQRGQPATDALLEIIDRFDAQVFQLWNVPVPLTDRPLPFLQPEQPKDRHSRILPSLEAKGKWGIGLWLLPGWFGVQLWRLRLSIGAYTEHS